MKVILSLFFLVTCIQADPATSLEKMLLALEKNPSLKTQHQPLERDWIGDIRGEKGEITHLRLHRGQISGGQIRLFRIHQSRYISSDAPVYRKSIPSTQQIRKSKTVADLKKLFGEGMPSFSGWGDGKYMRSSHSWVCFGRTLQNELTYINVFAHTYFDQNAKENKKVFLDKISIRSGKLRPADPDSIAEKKKYLSGKDLFEAEERKKEQRRQKFPQPLRDLVKIDEHPNDSDLLHLAKAIQQVRDKPDSQLLRQLVSEIHEGTLSMRSLLEHIMLNEHNLLKIRPWEAKKEALAVKTCIEALPLAKKSSGEDLAVIILKMCGGGEIKMQTQNRGSSITVTKTKDGYQLTYSGAQHPPGMKETQATLWQLYQASKK